MSSTNNHQVSYCYVNISVPGTTNPESTLHHVKIPQLSKKDAAAFQSSTYEQAKLNGPPTGISMLEWSYDSHYLATKCESSPTAVWIWDMTTL